MNVEAGRQLIAEIIMVLWGLIVNCYYWADLKKNQKTNNLTRSFDGAEIAREFGVSSTFAI